MSHDYAITIGGVALDTIATGLKGRFLRYTSGMRRGSNVVVPYKHGELFVPDKYFAGSDVLLEVFLPALAADDASQALSELALLLSSQSLVTVAQNDPHRGNIQARTELVTDPTPTQDRFTYLYGLRVPSGFWESVTESTAASASPPVVTTGGDRPIDDMVLTFAGPGYLQHTDPLGQVARVTIDAGAGAGTYVVDVGAGTVKKAGVDQDQFLTVSQPYWMKWQPDSSQSFTSTVAVAASWRNKWA